MPGLHPGHFSTAQEMVGRFERMLKAHEQIASGRGFDVSACGLQFRHLLDDNAQHVAQTAALEGLRRALKDLRSDLEILGVNVSELIVPPALHDDLVTASDIVSGWANEDAPCG